MPFVTGFLRIRRRPGRPDQGLPPGEEPVDPGYGVEEGELPEVEPPEPPPGIWPPPTPGHPVQPLPPEDPTPPGTIWPPAGTPEHPIYTKKYWVVAGIPGIGWRYICVDPSLMPRPTPHG